MVRQHFHQLALATRGRGLYEFTREVERWIASNQCRDGLLTIHVRHTSASLLIQENADRDVRADLEGFFSRLVPDGDPLFVPTAEGNDGMAADIRTSAHH
jgi:secondary thiamine-phosphate synthase enzyme